MSVDENTNMHYCDICGRWHWHLLIQLDRVGAYYLCDECATNDTRLAVWKARRGRR